MNILIVYCHPSRKSYTFQVLEQLERELISRDWTVTVSDLYAMNFQSDMTEMEYERERTARTEIPIPDDVLEEHRRIENADCIIFLYPVWWSDCPAKLKGWFDRVFCAGYAYGHPDKVQPMKSVRYGLAICTAGYSNEFLMELGIAQSMQTVMLDDRFGKRFENKEMVILGGTLQPEQARVLHQQKIEALISKISAYCA